MGQHRTDETRRRGISRGLSLTILAVIVVVALVVGWNLLGTSLSDDGDAAARTCVEGEQTVTVLADADIATPLATIAQAYSATRPVVRDACVTVTVRPSDPKTTLEGLTGTWDTASMGAYPAAWVPASSVWSAQLLAARSAIVDGDPESLVSSPVVLAVAPEFARAAAGRVSWIELPTLQRNDNSLAEFGLRGWGSLQMARASGPGSDATVLASQAVATEVGRATANGLTVADAQSRQVTSTLLDLRRRSPVATDGSAERTLTTIAGNGDPAGAAVHAVPITEQALYAATKDTAQPSVVELRPQGTTPTADHPVVDLTGPQVSATQAEAVAAFFRFARTPDQLRTITTLGFRGGASLPTRTAAVSFDVTATPMPAPEPAAGAAIAQLVLGG
ncbi:substrate-binding domain-containing protein [Williamsia herbipolensis]|uniref:Substrate-binding domain-containing protein n=1 Tax=Williamsia herbipolensis TaxID=1603258 RepID=A0AAU4K4D0_9NOCA|nr:substrate-binding domain-containing protein [Williamsia herbipolensis]